MYCAGLVVPRRDIHLIARLTLYHPLHEGAVCRRRGVGPETHERMFVCPTLKLTHVVAHFAIHKLRAGR